MLWSGSFTGWRLSKSFYCCSLECNTLLRQLGGWGGEAGLRRAVGGGGVPAPAVGGCADTLADTAAEKRAVFDTYREASQKRIRICKIHAIPPTHMHVHDALITKQPTTQHEITQRAPEQAAHSAAQAPATT